MSKVDRILSDELDPEDLDPTPRGGKDGRHTSKTDPKKDDRAKFASLPTPGGGAGCPLRLAVGGVVVATLTALLRGNRK